jgi:hypothetical protein
VRRSGCRNDAAAAAPRSADSAPAPSAWLARRRELRRCCGVCCEAMLDMLNSHAVRAMTSGTFAEELRRAEDSLKAEATPNESRDTGAGEARSRRAAPSALLLRPRSRTGAVPTYSELTSPSQPMPTRSNSFTLFGGCGGWCATPRRSCPASDVWHGERPRSRRVGRPTTRRGGAKRSRAASSLAGDASLYRNLGLREGRDLETGLDCLVVQDQAGCCCECPCCV